RTWGISKRISTEASRRRSAERGLGARRRRASTTSETRPCNAKVLKPHRKLARAMRRALDFRRKFFEETIMVNAPRFLLCNAAVAIATVALGCSDDAQPTPQVALSVDVHPGTAGTAACPAGGGGDQWIIGV